MEEIQTKATFEFTFSNVGNLSKAVYSPPFATSSNVFWQLKFIPSNPEYPEFCSVYLRSIFNTGEIHATSPGIRQGVLPATIYLRDPSKGNSAQSQGMRLTSGNNSCIIKSTVHNDTFSFYHRNRGFSRFYKSSMLPDVITLGVDFSSAEFKISPFMERLPGKTFPADLSEAWEQQLNKKETVDVTFNVQGTLIYASSSLLSRRSAYFQKIFQDKWAECSAKSNSSDESSDVKKSMKYTIDVPDFHPETFLEMLRFLYTDKVTLNKNEETHRMPLELFAIADKYLITELRQRAKAVMCRDINEENVAEFLFDTAWKWQDLKEEVFKFLVKHFQKVKKTDGWKSIIKNPMSYPRSGELFAELIGLLIPEESEEEESKPGSISADETMS